MAFIGDFTVVVCFNTMHFAGIKSNQGTFPGSEIDCNDATTGPLEWMCSVHDTIYAGIS